MVTSVDFVSIDIKLSEIIVSNLNLLQLEAVPVSGD